jgi:hypothetical protein
MTKKSQNRTAQSFSCSPRPLSEFEKQYADWQLKWQNVGTRLALSIGAGLAVFGVALALAVLADKAHHHGYGPKKELVMWLVSAGLFGIGLLLFWVFFRRKLTLAEKTACISGVLQRQITWIINPKTGAANTITRYMVGATQIIFPRNCESLLAPYEGQAVQFTAAMVSISNPLQFFGKNSMLSEPSSIAFALDFHGQINIHRAMKKYGLRVFKIQFKMVIGWGIAIVPLILMIAYEMQRDIATLALLLGTAFSWAVLITLVILAYEKIADAFGLRSKQIPYLEKLKG